jgi:chaperonin GroEL
MGDEEIAQAILSAIVQAGRDGLIHVKPAAAEQTGKRTRVTLQQDLRFPLGGLAEQEGRQLQQVAVLVSLRPLQAEEVRRVLVAYPRVAACLLCLCPGLEAEGAGLFRIAARNGARIILCTSPLGPWRDCFEDVAAATAARLIEPEEEGPIEVTSMGLGRAGLAWVEAGQLMIDQPGGPAGGGQGWISHLRQLIGETSKEEQQWHCLRLAQLTRGVVTVEISGQSLLETEQLDGLSCSALHAGRATIASGYVPGAGLAYLRSASTRLGDPASQALRWALEEPTRTLLAGSGLDVRDTLISLRADDSLGLDVLRNELVSWRTEGPVEPARIVRTVITCAIESASHAGAGKSRSGNS